MAQKGSEERELPLKCSIRNAGPYAQTTEEENTNFSMKALIKQVAWMGLFQLADRQESENVRCNCRNKNGKDKPHGSIPFKK